MNPPNLTQQRAIAYAIKPLAALSFLSACFVLHNLIVRNPQKLTRLYHRIIMVMFICVIPVAITDFWGTWAMPVGTPYRIGASGTVQTCSAQGFISVVFYLVVPFYYMTLSLYSCAAVKNTFMEQRYRWTEKWIHLGALCVSLPVAVIGAVQENLNPYLSLCFMNEYPRGCSNDPESLNPCIRGGKPLSRGVAMVYGWIMIAIYFIIPPLSLFYVRSWLKRAHRSKEQSIGKKKVIEEARAEVLRDVTSQARLYLLSFWSTQLLNIVAYGYELIVGQICYPLAITGVCLSSLQGFVLMAVYFRLEAKKKVVLPSSNVAGITQRTHNMSEKSTRPGGGQSKTLTVSDIRISAQNSAISRRRSSNFGKLSQIAAPERVSYHIFDGTADAESPWAKFLNAECDIKDGSADHESDSDEFRIDSI